MAAAELQLARQRQTRGRGERELEELEGGPPAARKAVEEAVGEAVGGTVREAPRQAVAGGWPRAGLDYMGHGPWLPCRCHVQK